MGGPGSSRWAISVTRLSMAGVPRLDVRSLAREGVLRSGTTTTVRWDNGASVTVEAVSDRLLALDYRLQLADGAIRPIRQVITLTTTRCISGDIGVVGGREHVTGVGPVSRSFITPLSIVPGTALTLPTSQPHRGRVLVHHQPQGSRAFSSLEGQLVRRRTTARSRGHVRVAEVKPAGYMFPSGEAPERRA
jgi:hypothetical protein